MTVGKKFLIILLIIFLVSITGVSAIEAPVNDTGVNDASVSAGVDDVKLDVSSGGEGDLSSVADENQIANDDENLTAVAGDGQANDEVLGAPAEKDILADANSPSGTFTFKDLRDAMNGKSGTFTFLGDCEAESNDWVRTLSGWSYRNAVDAAGIQIGSFTKIEGNGHYIDLKNLNGGRIFQCSDSKTITIQNLTFKNANPGSNANAGSAINFGANEKITLINCVFINNRQQNQKDWSGGAIYIKSANSLTLMNCNFTGNCANCSDGGALMIHDASSNIRIENCNFIRNSATFGGALMFHNAVTTFLVKGCTFDHNVALYRQSTSSPPEGGAIDFYGNCEGITIESTNFYNNEAYYSAPAISFDVANGVYKNIKFIDCKFENHTSEGSTISFTDASSINEVIFSGTSFKNCTSYANEDRGSAVYFKAVTKANFTDCTFTECSNTGNGGVLNLVGGSAQTYSFDNCKFENNYATLNGGAIYFKGACTISLSDCKFMNNKATSLSGGAIYVSTGCDGVTIYNSIFTGNNATTRYGGALYFEHDCDNLVIDKSRFANNSATSGGAIQLYADNNQGFSNVDIIYSNFTGNHVIATDSYGGAALTLNRVNDLNVSYCNFKNNLADNNGAVLLDRCSNILIGNSNFTANRAGYSAGGLYIRNGADNDRITISNSNFISNAAGDSSSDYTGGAIRCGGDGSGTLDIKNSVFNDNSAYRAGALSVNMYYNVNIDECSFDGNNATNSRGVLWISVTGKKMTLSKSNFTNNHANGQYGVLYHEVGESSTIDSCDFINNSANDVSVMAIKNVAVSKSKFIGNDAATGHGALHLMVGSSVTTSQFDNNTAVDGGAVYADGASVSVTYCNFTGNNATNGGAIYFASSGGTISNCKFINNAATNNGGAIVLAADGQKVMHSTFYGNDAVKGGAIYAASNNNLNISDSTFEQNTASNDGGAVHYDGTSGNGLTIYNDTFIKNTAVYNGGALHYIADGTHYRDCNRFNDEATGDARWTWNHGSKNIIYHSLFDANDDYYFDMARDIAGLRVTYTITVPKRAERGSTVIKVTIIDAVTGNPISSYTQGVDDGDWLPETSGDKTKIKVEVSYPADGTYNTTVSFSDANHDEKYQKFSFSVTDLSMGDFTRLQNLINDKVAEAIANHQSEVVITLNSKYTQHPTLDHGPINISTNGVHIIINGVEDESGQKPVIDAEHLSRIFDISADDVTINNIILRNGNASGVLSSPDNNAFGGAILWSGSNGVLANSTVYDNDAEYGGAVYWNGTNGNLTDSILELNNATYGGAVYVAGSDNHIYNSKLRDNTATYGGAVEWNATSGDIILSEFTQNHADNVGGAVHVSSENAVIKNSTFTLNSATSGGAIDLNETSRIEYSTFIQNSATNGGAVYVEDNAENSVIYNSTFSGNEASENGGAVLLAANETSIEKSNFNANRANDGGAVYVDACANSTEVTQSTFYDNSAILGSAVHVCGDNADVISSNFTENKNSAAVYSVANNTSIDSSKFEENTAGAIQFNGASDFNVDGTKFIKNEVVSALNIQNSNGTVANSEFRQNDGASAIAIVNSNGVDVTDSTFDSNQANSGSADISVTGSSDILLETLTVTNSHGATSSIYIDSDVTMDDITMSDWSSSPAVLFDGGNSTMMNSALDGNNAIKITEDAEVHLIRNNNTNAAGGEYSVSNNGTLYLEKNNFTNQIWVEVAGKINTTTTTRILNNETVIIKIGDDAFVNATIVDDNNNTIHVRTLELIANTTDIDTYCDGKTHYGTFANPAQGVYILSAKGIDGLLKNDLKTSLLKVKDADVSLDLEITQELAGEIVKIKATVNCNTPLAEGNVTFVINGQKHSYFLNTTEDLNGFTVTLPLNNITPDNYKVTAIYNGDDTHFNCSANGEFTVEKRDSNVSVFVENIFVGQYAVVNVNSTAYNGTVTLMFNGREEEIEIHNGKGTWTIPDLLDEGTYFITAIYNKNSYYESSFNSTSFKVIDYSIDVEVNETQFNHSAKIIVTLPEGAIGNTSTVSIYLNGTKLTNVTTSDGKTFIAYTDDLAIVGEYEVNVTYTGNETHPSAYKNGTRFNVTALKDYEFEINVTGAPFGEDTIINVTTISGIKQVNLTVGHQTYVVNLTNGEGSLVLNNLTAGDYTATASFAGNENYTAKQASENFTVDKATPAMIIVVPESPVAAGSPVDITVVVGKNATKKVIIYVNDEPYVRAVDANGNVTLHLDSVEPGVKVVTAEYMGDDNYYSAEGGSEQFNVSKRDAAITWNATVEKNNNVTFVFTFDDKSAEGNITIKIGDETYNATVENGVASVNVGVLNSTDSGRVFAANYSGDSTYNSKFIDVNATIGKLANTTMTVDITTPVEYGTPAVVTVTIRDVTDGNVTVWIGDESYEAEYQDNGVFVLVAPILPADVYNVNVTYTNGTKYRDMNRTGLELVIKKNESYVLDVQVSPAPYGNVTNITVTGPANVTVTITVDGVEYNVTLDENGTGTKPFDNLTGGIHTVVATFGDDNYTDKTDIEPFEIPKAASSITINALEVSAPNTNVTISVEVPDDATRQVLIKIGTEEHMVNVVNGTANYTIPYAQPGNYTISAQYLGDNNYNESDVVVKNITVDKYNTTVVVTGIEYAPNNNVTVVVEVNNTASGTVTIDYNNHNYTADVINGVAGISIGIIAPGTNVTGLVAVYSGSDKFYGNSTVVDDFTAQKRENTTLKLEIIPGEYGDNTTIRVTVPEDGDGNVTIYLDNMTPVVIPVTNGVAEWNVTPEVGIHFVNVTYTNDTKYAPKEDMNNTNFTISRDSHFDFNVTAEPRPYGEDTVITVNGPANVTVTVKIDDVPYEVHLDENGVGTKTLNNLTAGVHNVIAVFEGNDKYGRAENSTLFEIPKAASSITINVADVSDPNTNVTISVTVPANATKQVLIKVGNEEHTVTIVNGTANYTIPYAQPGNYTISAKYWGDDNYNESDVEVKNITVDKYNTAVVVSNITYATNNDATVIVNVNSTAGGTVTIEYGGENHTANVTNGVARVNIGIVPPNTTVTGLTALYSGDKNFYANSTAIDDFTAPKLENITIKVDVIPGEYGKNTTIRVTVPEDGDGNVTFYLDNMTPVVVHVENGVAELNVTPDVGIHFLNVTYTNDTKYAPRELNDTNFTIGADTHFDFNVTVDPKPYGEDTVITVNGPANVTVKVSVVGESYDVVLDENGVGTQTLNNITAGVHNVVAVFEGNDKYGRAENSTSFEIPKAASAITINVADVSEPNTNVTISVSVPANATKQVLIKVGNEEHTVTIVNGTANYTIPYAQPGNYTISAKYWGDDNYNESDVEVKNITVDKYNTTVVVSDITYATNNDATVIVNVNSTAGGTVTIEYGGENHTANVTNGVASVNIGIVPPNTTVTGLTAVYSGDKNFYANSTAIDAFTAPKLENTTLKVDVIPAEYGKNTTIRVTVPEDGDGNVTFYLDNMTPVVIKVTNGVAELNVTPEIGIHFLNVTYTNDTKYASRELNDTNFTIDPDGNFSFIVTADPKPYGEDTAITVTGPANITVTIKIDEVPYEVTLDANGVGTRTFNNLTAGKHDVTAIFAGNGNLSGVTNSTIFVIPKAASAITINVADVSEPNTNVTISVSVPANATKQVLIKVGNEEHTVTIVNGTANYTIPYAQPGNYTISAKYWGDGNYNESSVEVKNITVDKYNTTVVVSDITYATNNDATVIVNVNSTAGGTVTIEYNNKNHTANVTNGVASVNIGIVPPNTTVTGLTALYSGDKNFYANSTAIDDFTAPKLENTTLKVDVIPGEYGKNTTIRVTVPEDGDGNVTFYLDNMTPVVIKVTNGVAELNVTPEVGIHFLNVTYTNDTKYASRELNGTNFTIGADTHFDFNVTVDPKPYGEDTVITVNGPANVTVKVSVAGESYDVVLDENGVGTQTLNNLTAGIHNVVAVLEATDKYGRAENYSSFEIPKAASSISINVADVSAPNSDVVINVTVPGSATKQVLIKVDNEEHSVDVENGHAVYVIEKAQPGNYTITAKYLGDDNYNASDVEVKNITVDKYNTTVVIDDIKYAENNNVTVVVKVNSTAGGTVTIEYNGENHTANVTNGVASVSIGIIAPNTPVTGLTAVYSGDKNFHGNSTGIDEFTTPKLENTTLKVDVIPGEYGKNTTIRVTVPEDGDGNVTFYLDNMTPVVIKVTNGVAELNVTPEVGIHFLNVTYTNDTKYASRELNGTNFTIGADTHFDFNVTVDPKPYGEDTVITVNGPANVTVKVSVAGESYDVVLDENGVGTQTLNNLTAGIHNVVAVLEETDKYGRAENFSSFEIPKAASAITINVADVSAPNSDVVINVTVPDAATKQVLIKVGNEEHLVDVENGHAVYTIEKAQPGNYTISAQYKGDGNFNESSVEVKNITVDKYNTTVVIDDIKYAENNNVTVVVKVNSTAGGTVTIEYNGENHTANVTIGVASVSIGIIAPNTDLTGLTAVFSGDKNFHGNSTAIDEFTTPKLENTTLKVDVIPGEYGKNTTIRVTVPEDGDGNVTFYLDNMTPVVIKVTNGVAELNVTPEVGIHFLNVTYTNDTKYAPRELNGTNFTIGADTHFDFNVTVDPKPYGEDTVITVNGPANVTVKVSVAGESYDVLLDENGVGTQTLNNLTAGIHNVVAVLEETDKYGRAENFSSFEIPKAASAITINVADVSAPNSDVVINVTVPDAATKQVLIKVGNEEHLVDVENGHAVYVIEKAQPGNYTISAQYKGDDNYNASDVEVKNITVDKYNTTVVIDDIKYAENNNVTVVVKVNSTAGGTVTIEYNGENHTANVTNGVASVSIGIIAPNTDVTALTAVYSGDKNFYGNSTGIDKFTTPKLNNTTLDVDVIPGEYGDNTTIIVHVPEDGDGNVTIYLDNMTPVVIPVKDGVAILNVTPDVGIHFLNVTYTNDTRYEPRELNGTNFTIGADTHFDFNVTVDPKPYGEDTVITVNGPANVTVKVSVAGESYDVLLDENGVGTQTLNNLTAGIHNVVAVLEETDKYGRAENYSSFEIPKAASSISINVADVSAPNSDVVINVTVPDAATKQVLIKVGNEEHSVDVENGHAVYVIEKAQPGNYTISAQYKGDGNYNESSVEVKNITVDKYNTTVEIEDIEYATNNNVTVVVKVNSTAEGTVTIEYNDCNYTVNVTNGVARVSIGIIAPNTDVAGLTAVYSGSKNFYGNSTGIDKFTTPKLDNTTLEVEVIPGEYGDNTTIIVHVPEDGDGNVTIYLDNMTPVVIPVKDGVAVLNVTPDVGVHLLNVTYTNDTRYEPRELNGTEFLISRDMHFDFNVTVSPDDIKYGDEVTITVNAPAGVKEVNLTIDEGTTIIVPINSTGVGEYKLSNLSAGKHYIEVTFAGNDDYGAASNSTSFRIAQITPQINVTATPEVADAGGDVTIDVELPEDATGWVNIIVDGKDNMIELNDGKATLTVHDVQPNEHNVTVLYIGDENYTSAEKNASFSAKRFNTTVVLDKVEVDENNNVTVTVKVDSGATGNVTVTIGDENYTAEIVDGVAVINLGNQTKGVKDINITYPGDENYIAVSIPETIDVPALRNYTIPMNSSDIEYGGVGEVTVELPKDFTKESVTFYLDDEPFTGTVDWTDNVAKLTIPDLQAGDHTVKVHYAEDAIYAEKENSTTFHVSTIVPSYEINITESIDVGQEVNITVKLPDNANGTITVDVNGTQYVVPVVNGEANVSIPKLDEGVYPVTVTYSGFGNYNGTVLNTTEVVVSKVSEPISANTTNITVGETAVIDVTLPSDATGNVTVTVAGIEKTVGVHGGLNSIEISGIPVGNHTVDVVYNGDGKYTESTTSTEIGVSPRQTSEDDIIVIDNGDGTVTVIVPEGATGNVTVDIEGETVGPVEIENGKAIVNLTNSSARPGKHNITVNYSGDDNNKPVEKNATGVIPKWDSNVTASVSTIREGDNAVITVDLYPSDATGTVLIDINGTGYSAEIKDGKAVFTVPGLSEGEYDIKVTYPGDSTYNGNSTSATLTVQEPIVPVIDDKGNNSQVVFKVPGNGTVNVTIDGAPRDSTKDENGTVKVNLTGLIPGEHELVIVYTDENGTQSIVNQTITVPRWDSEVSASAATIRQGDDANVIVKVGSSNMTGLIRVDINGTGYYANMLDGVVTIVAPGLMKGTYDANVTYDGNEIYNPSNNTFTLIVEAPLVIEVDGEGNGSQVVVKLPENSSNNATILIDGQDMNAEVENDTAVANLTGIEPGEHNITVIYTDKDGTQSIVNTTITVPRWDSSVEAAAATIREGDDSNIIVKVGSENMTGLVRVDIDGTGYYANMTDGVITIVAPGIKKGTYLANVTYDGNWKYMPANNTFTLVVEAPITINVEGAGNSTRIVVDLPENATDNLTVMVDGSEYPVTYENGSAMVNLNNVSAGNHNVAVVYTDSNGTKSVVNQSIVVYNSIKANDMTRGWNSPYDYEAEFLDKDGHVMANVDMQFKVNGKTYTVKTDNKGIAKLTDSHLDIGKYDVEITNLLTGEVMNHTTTIVKRLLYNKDITMDFRDGTSYVVRAIGDDGQPVGAGEVVKISANGVDYARVTNADGYAILVINLNPTTYKVVAQYAAYKVTNKLVVKQTLKLVKKTVSVKKSAKKLVLKAKLKWTDGKPIKGKKIVFKFKGKSYNAKTNSKGIAKVTVKKSVIKKLKKGKKYVYSAKYFTNMVKGKVKCK